jgi:hypothetical protein
MSVVLPITNKYTLLFSAYTTKKRNNENTTNNPNRHTRIVFDCMALSQNQQERP